MSDVMTLTEFAAMSERAMPKRNVWNGEPLASRPFLWYVATPYTHADPHVRERRCALAQRATAQLMEAGVHAYSPIANGHPVSFYMRPETVNDHDFWMRHCYDMLERCNGLLVITMEGWAQSKGVAMEIERWTSIRGGTNIMYASAIASNEPWHPRFARRAFDVCGDPRHERAEA